jgi:hypothetical protein
MLGLENNYNLCQTIVWYSWSLRLERSSNGWIHVLMAASKGDKKFHLGKGKDI